MQTSLLRILRADGGNDSRLDQFQMLRKSHISPFLYEDTSNTLTVAGGSDFWESAIWLRGWAAVSFGFSPDKIVKLHRED